MEAAPNESSNVIKVDGVGPVDNKPSTDKPYNFIKKKKHCDM